VHPFFCFCKTANSMRSCAGPHTYNTHTHTHTRCPLCACIHALASSPTHAPTHTDTDTPSILCRYRLICIAWTIPCLHASMQAAARRPHRQALSATDPLPRSTRGGNRQAMLCIHASMHPCTHRKTHTVTHATHPPSHGHPSDAS
jgi:hypothetical protein